MAHYEHLPIYKSVMTAALYTLLLGALSGLFLTLMDRIDEHGVVQRFKTPLAWLCGALAAASMAASMHCYSFVYPFLFAQCLEWTVKGKIDFPSHVFFLFLLGLWFGHRIDLLQQYAPAIAFFCAVRWFSGSWLKKRITPEGRAARIWYASYLEKFLSDIVFALFLGQWLLVVYAIGYTWACRITKQMLPGDEKGARCHA